MYKVHINIILDDCVALKGQTSALLLVDIVTR